MRILILANNDVGLYKFRKELIETLLIDNEVYACLPYGELVPKLTSIGMHYISDEFDRRGMNPVGEIRHYLKYLSIIKEIKPDIVLTYTIKPNIFGGMACARLKIPYVVNVTGLGTALEQPGLFQSVLIQMYKYGVRKAQKVFFQNTSNYEFMASQGFKKEKCGILPGSGVDLRENCYEPYPSEQAGIRFLFVGRIMKDKGIDEYLACAKYIHDKYPNCSFDIVGGYDEESYRTIIDEYQRAGIVCSMGHQHDVHSIIKTHHALIQPSYHEGLSNVLLEASASGRPVIASMIPGCREVFDDGISGIGFEPRDCDSLIRAVEVFLSKSSDERAMMGIFGRKKIEENFDRQKVVNAYLQEIRLVNAKKA